MGQYKVSYLDFKYRWQVEYITAYDQDDAEKIAPNITGLRVVVSVERVS